MIQINSNDNPKKIREFLIKLHQEIGSFLKGETFEVKISPDVDLRVAATMLREIAEIFDNSGTILDRAKDDSPFRRDPDEDDPADFWKGQ